MYVWVLPACTSVYNMLAGCPQKPEEDLGCPGTVITDGCELLYEYWELNSGPPEGNPMLLTAESYLWAQILIIKILLLYLFCMLVMHVPGYA